MNRAHKLKAKYGITLEEYNLLLINQGGGCAVCGYIPHQGEVLCVDHCHNSLRVRGLLCHPCNKALGNLKDDPELLQKAIEYLIK